MMRRWSLILALAAVLLPSAFCDAQELSDSNVALPKSYITYAAEPQIVAAGKISVLTLRFRVQDGFHVNSHTPKSELLIPTRLTLDAVAGVKVKDLQYPAGTAYSFSFDQGEKLDVYSGSFALRLFVTSASGEHQVAGALHYQACDQAACYPPKALPVQVLFTAR